jgi:hypothetical protein
MVLPPEIRPGNFTRLYQGARPKVDLKVSEFVKSTTFDPADFAIRSDGIDD